MHLHVHICWLIVAGRGSGICNAPEFHHLAHHTVDLTLSRLLTVSAPH